MFEVGIETLRQASAMERRRAEVALERVADLRKLLEGEERIAVECTSAADDLDTTISHLEVKRGDPPS
jgi:hypothetical protein